MGEQDASPLSLPVSPPLEQSVAPLRLRHTTSTSSTVFPLSQTIQSPVANQSLPTLPTITTSDVITASEPQAANNGRDILPVNVPVLSPRSRRSKRAPRQYIPENGCLHTSMFMNVFMNIDVLILIAFMGFFRLKHPLVLTHVCIV